MIEWVNNNISIHFRLNKRKRKKKQHLFLVDHWMVGVHNEEQRERQLHSFSKIVYSLHRALLRSITPHHQCSELLELRA